jgi:type II secretory ATPase GspE/PulE/Tfp pilus assembly ATPase PilB-like protein
MDSFNFADALLGVLAQRLVRRLCPECKVSYTPSAAELEEIGEHRNIAPYRPKGCKNCDGTGYKGRLPVFELLSADAGIKQLVQKRAPVSEIAAAAAAGGMRTLKQDAIAKVIEGHTDMSQVRTV